MSIVNDVALMVASEYDNVAVVTNESEKAINPANLQIFADLVVSIINIFKDCKPPTPTPAAKLGEYQSPKDIMANPNFMQKMKLRRTIREHMSPLDWHQKGNNMTNAFLNTGAKLTQDQVDQLMASS